MPTSAAPSKAAAGTNVPPQQGDNDTSSQCNFLGIPRELRDQIYDLLITDTKQLYENDDAPVKAFTQDAPTAPALLRTNSQINGEYTDRLPQEKKLTIHSAGLLRASSVPEGLVNRIHDCTVYLPVFVGHESIGRRIQRDAARLQGFAAHFPRLQAMHVKFASRCLMGYSESEHRADQSWCLESAVEELTKGPWMQDLEIFELNDHVVICRDCRDLHRALHTDPGDGRRCKCHACQNVHQVYYLKPESSGRSKSAPPNCKECGGHNIWRWGVWSRDGGWTVFHKERFRRGPMKVVA